MAKARIRGLDCSAPADAMIRLVLRAQVNALCKHRDTALDWRDPEGVHDMRVLSRRLRSAINDFRHYFRKGSLPRPQLRTIARSLGQVRDIDVALMALHDLKSTAEGAAAEGIQLLISERRAQRTKGRAKLKAAIEPAAVEEFRKQFRAKLKAMTIVVPGGRSTAQAAPAPAAFSEIATHVVSARVRDFLKASPCLYRPYDIEKLHELRILAKRLRYSMELFAACLGKELATNAKEVAHMQTSLGELHDCDVWIKDLGTRLRRLARKTTAGPDDWKLRAGASWLLQHFAEERMEHYRNAVARLEQWESDRFLESLRLVPDRAIELPQSDAAQAA